MLSDDWRIGIGYDIHAVVPGRPLRLGGVTITGASGLAGHSDGDVALHAVIDAMFGAAGLGDIGEHFPDDDPQWAGCDSRDLVARAAVLVGGENWMVHNVDVTIVAQRPRLSGHKRLIVASIAELLSVPPQRVSIKAKTNEGFDAVGRGEAIACQAGLLLRRATPA